MMTDGMPSSRNSHCQPDAVEGAHDPARDRAADQPGHGHGGHEEGGDAPAPRGRVPIGQVQDDAREEPGFGRAQQEAQDVEHVHAGHEHHAGGNDAPGDHDARDPDLRAHFVQDDVAGNLENEVADEEDAGAQPVHRFAELQFLQHLQLGEAHVHAVQVGHHVAHHQ
jgi:hypothetical protein